MHYPHVTTIVVSKGVPGLGILANQEWVKRIRAHIQVHELAIATLPISLTTGRAQLWPRQAMEFPELAFGGGVVEVGITLVTDYRCRHRSSRRSYISFIQLYASVPPDCAFL